MRDVFISYAREDRPKAELIAQALGREGLSVWWDRKIPPGKSYSQAIEEALDSAKCIIVLWTKQSVASDWVKDEAEEGKRRGILIPAMIEDVKVPLGFRQSQTANLIGWKGDSAHPELQVLLDAVSAQLGRDRRRAEPVAPAWLPLPDVLPDGAIFISCAREDLEEAKKLQAGLSSTGLDVWFDKTRLRGGDAFMSIIKSNIERCSFFLPLISQNSVGTRDPILIEEWTCALDRAKDFPEGEIFIIPIVIDRTAIYKEGLPKEFRRIQYADLPGGEATLDFIDRMNELYRRRRPPLGH